MNPIHIGDMFKSGEILMYVAFLAPEDYVLMSDESHTIKLEIKKQDMLRFGLKEIK